jgi:hypothetical protein
MGSRLFIPHRFCVPSTYNLHRSHSPESFTKGGAGRLDLWTRRGGLINRREPFRACHPPAYCTGNLQQLFKSFALSFPSL